MHTIKRNGQSVSILDQRELPLKEVYREYHNYYDVAEAISKMEIRGAPAIGIAAAMGIALAARSFAKEGAEAFEKSMGVVYELFASLRPTAVNLHHAVERMKSAVSAAGNGEKAASAAEREADAILREDLEANKAIGENGSRFLSDGDVVLTHCNAGSLATGGFGTAIGVIRAAAVQGKKLEVIVCETRPLFQGSRLTAWELLQDKIPVTVITDSMAGWFMRKGLINKVIAGADRIAVNGDTANKIGTYSHSVLAKEHGIGFYIAAPVSTIDANMPDGAAIVIEERPVDEVAFAGNRQIVPEGVRILNPAFDVTPACNISAIITERGVCEKPDEDGIGSLLKR